MLKGIDPLVTPDLLAGIARAGHGDVVAIVDRNFPASSTGAPVVELPGADVTAAVRAICALLPVDIAFQAAPVKHMLTGDGARGPAVDDVRAALVDAEGRDVGMEGLDRFAFYDAAAGAVLVVHTSDARPYACFLIAKGVL
ncbi:MAG: hypothetical protein BGO38_12680 [Cellulomonas sp. 73-145]|mgnify:CR=1 FL=1|uniref:RbsD/FucU family protein n=1 Tax=unclassified Cellulomonas TaxID=2620175 RepID=UPI0009280FA4|nr:RbsD/FucU domain-containing protein [Cellulomonas sp. 73-145]MBN9327375.1 transport protein RbsD/FucU [Cellulomonas sp.]OJV59648.1 MAG: hypothetical protein BGO38_12680 [Cellulomonas sp. 73-145]